MKPRWIALACIIACFPACDQAEQSSGIPAPLEPVDPLHFLIEAEACDAVGEITAEKDASGSAFVFGKSGSEEPVLRCDIPVSEKSLSVWMRRKGGAVEVFTSAEQDDIRSVGESEAKFVWSFFGEIPAGEESRQLIVTSSGATDEAVQIDCILFCEEPIDDKDSLLTPLPPIEIDTESTVGKYRTAPAVWGINLHSGGDPKMLSDPGYAENIAWLAPHMVRVHNDANLGDSSNDRHGLLDLKTRTWDEQKVRKVVMALLELGNTGEIMINIPNWPDWMDADKDGFLDGDQANDYAELLGRFAEIVWEFPDARDRVLFEIPNERDKLYHADLVSEKQQHRVAELARAYIGAARRIGQLAPGARVGGSSAADAFNMDFHEQFIATTAPELDFYSVHLHVSGDPQESDSSILGKADASAEALAEIRDILNKNSPNRRIPISLSEYNIARNLDTPEPRLTNAFGAVWDACFVMAAFGAGVDSAAAWNENGEIYGKFSPDNGKRPAAHLYHVLNTEFAGSCALLKTEEPDLLSVLATEDGNSLLGAYRGLRDRKISLPEGEWTGWVLENGLDAPQEITAQGETDLPGVSLLYLKKSAGAN